MTPKQFAEEMRKIYLVSCKELRHCDADALLCEVLKQLGYVEGVEIYEEMDKWYA